MDTKLILFFLGITILIVLLIWFYYQYTHGKAKKIKPLYDEALKKKDKQEALRLGRAYYSALRGGTLSIYDEQAITNDIASIS